VGGGRAGTHVRGGLSGGAIPAGGEAVRTARGTRPAAGAPRGRRPCRAGGSGSGGQLPSLPLYGGAAVIHRREQSGARRMRPPAGGVRSPAPGGGTRAADRQRDAHCPRAPRRPRAGPYRSRADAGPGTPRVPPRCGGPESTGAQPRPRGPVTTSRAGPGPRGTQGAGAGAAGVPGPARTGATRSGASGRTNFMARTSRVPRGPGPHRMP
jgi:hypothetical protein